MEMKLSRRLSLASALTLAAGVHVQAALPRGGCCLLLGDLGSMGLARDARGLDEPIESSGNNAFDKALGRSLVKLPTLANVRPSFGYYNDSVGENAYASPDSSVQGYRGTVLFGLNLLRQQTGGPSGWDIAVLGICAHEFAHIYQFDHGIQDHLLVGQRTVVRTELHADFLAGFFIGVLRHERPGIAIQRFGQLFYDLGDKAFNSRQHHGTPEERVNSVQAGFKYASAPGVAYDDAAQEGIRYVTKSH